LRTALSLDGAPRKNGELVFDEPWQARAFGLAIAVAEQGPFDWEGFRSHLITSVGTAPARPYWESWLSALEGWLGELGLTG
jgi:nitrile hydratase accessory protein